MDAFELQRGASSMTKQDADSSGQQPDSLPSDGLFQTPLSRPSERTKAVLSKLAFKPDDDFRDTFTTSGSSSRRRLKIGIFPAPLIVQPLISHRQSFILLHGRGGNAMEFGYNLLATKVAAPPPPGPHQHSISSNSASLLRTTEDRYSNEITAVPETDSTLEMSDSLQRHHAVKGEETLKEAFPHAKFIFPTAAPLRAKIFNRKPIFQWMDNYSLADDPSTTNTDLQISGLQASTKYIHDLLTTEIELVGVGNVVLGGLSQGCACALTTLLTWRGAHLPVMFGMCGWLPFARSINDGVSPATSPDELRSRLWEDAQDSLVNDEEGEDDNDLFDRSSGITSASDSQHPMCTAHADTASDAQVQFQSQPSRSRSQQMLLTLYDILDQEISDPISVPQTSIFLGHGVLDQTVPIECGKEAATTMSRILDHLQRSHPKQTDERYGVGSGASDNVYINADTHVTIGTDVDVTGSDTRKRLVHWNTYNDLGHWYSPAMLRDIVDFVRANTDWD